MKTLNMDDLYTKRLLVFIETDDCPNEYNQVIFNQEQFKRVSDAVVSGKIVPEEDLRPGFEAVDIKISEKQYKLPDEFTDFE